MAEKLFMTALSPTMERGTITEWHKKEGKSISSGDIICEVETDKAVMEYESDFDAVLLKVMVGEGQSAAVGEVIGVYGESGEDLSEFSTDVQPLQVDVEAAVEPEKKETQVINPKAGRRLKVSPLARKMAADMRIPLETVIGSGYDGRIIKRDILGVAENHTALDAVEVKQADAVISRVSAMRATIAQRLTDSKFSAPHFYLTMQADMSSLLK
ncbi:MAG TPA: hypothetical protein DCO79_05370 [Spirochaeta sp.]|nr:hypothetical protein [Spirochaeta sp.]